MDPKDDAPVSPEEAALAGLSAAEREALADEIHAKPGDSDADDSDSEPDTGDEDEDEDEGADEKQAAKPAEAKAGADEKDEGKPASRREDPFVPLLDEGEAEHETKLKEVESRLGEIKKEIRETRAKVRAGDLSSEDADDLIEVLEDERELLSDSRSALRTEAALAKERGDFNKKMRQQQWKWELNRFKRENELFQKKDWAQALDLKVAELASVEANLSKPFDWFIEEASKLVVESISEASASLSGRKGKSAEKPSGGKKPAAKQEQPVKTLGDMQAGGSDSSAPRDEEFADLDSLTGMELEMALDRLDRAKAETYLDTTRLHG